MELGADDYLTKPFSREELLSCIETQLNKIQSRYESLQHKIEELKMQVNNQISLVNSISAVGNVNNTGYDHFSDIEDSLTTVIISKHISFITKSIELELKKSEYSREQKYFLRQLRNKMNSSDLLKNNWNNFQRHFNQQFPGFINAIAEKYENLTNNELIFLSATKLGFNTFQISDLMNITPQSVRKSRYRLKKKKQAPPDKNFSTYIQSLNF